MLKLCVIPFSGFYHSEHDSEIDRSLEMSLSDDSGDPYPDLIEKAYFNIDWQKVHFAYAQKWALAWGEAMGVRGLEFESLQSPREYNFTTDRIFAHVPLAELQRMLAELPRALLDSVAAEMFTSRSGFISFYSPDVESWGDIKQWDHNQCLALLQAWQNHTHPDFDDWSILEDWSGNGVLDNLIDAGVNRRASRCFTVAYLRRERGVSA